MAQPLAGVRVIEIGQEIQGPFAGLILGDLGAQVTKIENRSTGDLSRWALAGRGSTDVPNHDVSPYFIAMNRGKRSVTLDLKQPEAIEIVRRMAGAADVVLTNYRPGVLDRLGLGFEGLKEVNPRIIFAQGSSFGTVGPWVQRPSRDILAQAATGLLAKGGFEGEAPLPAPFAVADTSGGMSLAMGILSALFARERTGEAQKVDVSIYGTLIAMQAWEINCTSLTGQEPNRAGRGHQFIQGLWGAYATSDGYIAFSAVDDGRWPRFCKLLGVEHLEHDPRFETGRARQQNGEVLRAEVEPVLCQQTTEYWLSLLQEADILVADVVDYRSVLGSEQAQANGYVRPMDHPEAGNILVGGSPVMVNGEVPGEAGPPPEHGQQTEEALLECGYSWEEIAQLREADVI